MSLQSASAGALEDLFLMLVVPQDISVPPLTAVEIPFLVTAPIKYSFSVGDYIPAEVGDFSTLVTLNYYYSINGVSDFFSRTGQTITVVEPNSGGTAPVPEPATMLLFATGLAGLAAVGRRRRKQ
ncbi:MAG: PEP-CTERM sorting domain-containing protein [Candidatus Moraniibacteriota bacterium]